MSSIKAAPATGAVIPRTTARLPGGMISIPIRSPHGAGPHAVAGRYARPAPSTGRRWRCSPAPRCPSWSGAPSRSCTRRASTAPPRISTSSSGPGTCTACWRCAPPRAIGGSGLLALAGEDPLARRLHRRHLQLGQRPRRRGRDVVRARHRAERAGLQRDGRAGGGEPLVEGVRHGARALRRGRRGPHHPRATATDSTGTGCWTGSASIGGCCWPI